MGPRTTAALWTVFTVTAVATGLGAVTIVRNALTAPAASSLSQSQVVAELATATPRLTPPAPTTTPPDGPGRTPTQQPRDTRTGGGTTTTAPGASHGTSPPATATTSPPATHTRKPSATPPTTRTLASRGGTVVARCSGARVYLQSWSPQTGYRVEDVRRGPGRQADVWFEGPYEVHMRITCQDGLPVAEVEQEVDGG